MQEQAPITVESLASIVADHLKDHAAHEIEAAKRDEQLLAKLDHFTEKIIQAMGAQGASMQQNARELSKMFDFINLLVKVPICFMSLGIPGYFFHTGRLDQWVFFACVCVMLSPVFGESYIKMIGTLSSMRNPPPK